MKIANPSMTKQEFIARQQAMEAAVKKRGPKWVIIFFGSMACAIPALKFIETHSEATWLAPAFAISLLVLLFGSVGWLLLTMSRDHKKFGVLCPNCGKALVSFSSAIAIASGNCGSCGKPVFEPSSNQSQSKG